MAIMNVQETIDVCIQGRYGEMFVAHSFVGKERIVACVNSLLEAEDFLRKCVREFSAKRSEPIIIDGGKLRWKESDFTWSCDDQVMSAALQKKGW